MQIAPKKSDGIDNISKMCVVQSGSVQTSSWQLTVIQSLSPNRTTWHIHLYQTVCNRSVMQVRVQKKPVRDHHLKYFICNL